MPPLTPAQPPAEDPSTPTNLYDLPTYNILLTGFDRFGDPKNGDNPSFLTVAGLPTNVVHAGATQKYRARIFAYPAAIRTSYPAVQEAIPSIFGAHKFHFVIHLGMAPTKYYRLETVACKLCDRKEDVDGKMRDPKIEPEYYDDLPDRLETSVDVGKVLELWKSACEEEVGLQGADYRSSRDAGQYLCDYIFYASLAYFTSKGKADKGGTQALFLHVPPYNDAESVGRNVQATIGLVHALVRTLL